MMCSFILYKICLLTSEHARPGNIKYDKYY